jgi:hypothetical protein
MQIILEFHGVMFLVIVDVSIDIERLMATW